jgi:phosphohistidine phosphatase
MEILLVRHAIAVERSEDLPDADRPLTDKGHRRFARAVDGLDHLDLHLDGIIHSPWLRAVQTARLLADITDGDIHASGSLAGPPGEALLAELAGVRKEGRIALVGHEPWLSQLMALLLISNASLGESMPLKKGGVAWLSGVARPGGMTLIAMFPPRALRRLARRHGGDDD